MLSIALQAHYFSIEQEAARFTYAERSMTTPNRERSHTSRQRQDFDECNLSLLRVVRRVHRYAGDGRNNRLAT